MMQKNLIIISSLLGGILLLYLLSIPIISSNRVIILLFILLQLYSIFVIYSQQSKEDFYFEVSPEKQKCMDENVSLEQPPGVRSKGCCPVYTVGGKLKYVEEWKKIFQDISWLEIKNTSFKIK